MTLGNQSSSSHSVNTAVNFAQLSHEFMKTHAMFFKDPVSVEKHLTARLVDDELRASWLDGLMQCQLHLRFLWQDILMSTYGKYGYLEPSIYRNDQVPACIDKALEKLTNDQNPLPMDDASELFDFNTLIESILAIKMLGPMHCLSLALGVCNIRVTRTMLTNMKKLYDQLMVLTPYQRLKDFEAIPMADAALYQMPLIADKSNPMMARPGTDNATAAIITIMSTIPLGEVWIEKHRSVIKRVREVTII